MSTEVEFNYSDVFKDLVLQDVDDIQIKAPLAGAINRELAKKNLSPENAADLLNISQAICPHCNHLNWRISLSSS